MMIDSRRFSDAELHSLLGRFAENGGNSPACFGSYLIFPGLCDVHVHFREPGYFYKESIKTGSLAAARGGFTTVCAMPNLDPIPDSVQGLEAELALIRRDSCVNILPYGAITVGEKGETLSDMEAIAPFVCAFSDDGRGVQSLEMMREAMKRARSLGKIIAAHCEDTSLLHGGYIHDGTYARTHGHAGISSESEYAQIARDLELAAETGVAYHICHVSTRQSVELIRQAKQSGVDVTCETAPHYLTLTDDCLEEDGRFKMNPPLRSWVDREALLEGLADGTVDMVATDHAPHSAEEKSRGLRGSLFGIVGLETAFPVLYTELVKSGTMTVEALIDKMCTNPRRRFGIPTDGEDYTIFEVGTPYTVNPDDFRSKGRSTPFAGRTVYGRCMATVIKGRTVWQENSTEN